MRDRRRLVLSFLVALSPLVLFAEGPAGASISNWPAPPAWSPRAGRGVTTKGDITDPLPFIAVTPCRVADTRGNGFTGSYGPPALAANAVRSFTIIGHCGIPNSAHLGAVSFNFGVLNVGGAGDLRVFPAGGAVPLVSTLNYNANTGNIANAAIVALGENTGAISVQADAVSVDLIIDVNGYYAEAPQSLTGSFHFINAGGEGSAAIWGESQSTSPRASGVYGLGSAPSGSTCGVLGWNVSADFGASGVRGVLVNPPTEAAYLPAGMRGETNSHGYGVLGIALNLSNGAGVGASLVDIDGNQVNYALLAAAGPHNYAVYGGGDFGGTGAKFFVEPHPTDPSRVIRYVSLEGPEAGTYFRGRGRFQRGRASIEVPEDFRMVTDSEGLSIQVTPIGGLAMVSVVRIGLNGILVEASRDVDFFFTVNGVRRTHKDLTPIAPGDEYMPRDANARIPAYLTDAQKAMLIANGTYREDGTVNMETARRLGWDAIWMERSQSPSPH